ncbi:chymotrypsinogen A-like [Anopheles aquasalis]|uniref:chymotrypsinogen A-like n=1 Tax=Anopheles aquasalis TaxID=42839 RepID=UPI00215AC93E|nr:chymotrypsinogen A-like [Anopheles aquasalis]
MIVSRSIGVLIGVSTLATVVWGLACRTPSDTLGKCVELQECSKWNQILDRSNANPYISISEFKLLNEALGACADSDGPSQKKLCCAEEDIFQKRVDIEPICLSGASDAIRSENTSFGVFLYINGRVNTHMKRCVGSLIRADYVLTSAHCVHKVASENIEAYVNAKYVYNEESGTVAHGVKPSRVESVIIHKEYNPPQLGFDVALLRLKERVDLHSPGSPYPICIPTAKEHYASGNSILHSFGWGANSEGVFSDIKLSVTLQRIWDLAVCASYGGRLKVTSEVLRKSGHTNPICTIGISGHNLFEGYSGAPLMYRKNGAWFLLGTVGKPLNPAETRGKKTPNRVLSTSVQTHVAWINEVLESQGSPEGIAAMDLRINPL